MMTMITRLAGLAVVVAVVGCGGSDQDAADTAVGSGPDAPMGDMPGMDHGAGMQDGDMGAMMSEGMIEQMRSHMEQMQGVSADSLRQLMPAHRQMAANMLAQMNTEMRQMNMPADGAWRALVDSIRQDLVRMPELAPSEMAAFMAAHRERMQRMMERHAAMM